MILGTRCKGPWRGATFNIGSSLPIFYVSPYMLVIRYCDGLLNERKDNYVCHNLERVLAAQGSKGGIKNNENAFTNNKIGTLDHDRDRSRRPAAHGHRFGRISGSIFVVQSIKTNKECRTKNSSKNRKPKNFKNMSNKDTKMHFKSMPKGISNQC